MSYDKAKLLFYKYHNLILQLANSDEGRYLLGQDSNRFPIIDVLPNGFIEDTLEEKNGDKLLRATVFTYERTAKIFLPIIEKIAIASSYDWQTFRRIQENQREAFLHFSGLEAKNHKYPAILLTESGDLFPSQDALINGGGDVTWSTEHDRATGGTPVTSDPNYLYARNFSGVYNITRVFFNFDLAAITAITSVSASTISVYGVASGDNTDSHTYNIYNSSAADTPVAGDFNQAGTTAYSTAIGMASWNTAGYNNYAGNSTMNDYIATRDAAIAKFAFREAAHDVANSAPPSVVNSFIGLSFTAHTGTTQDPKLIFTYVAATAYTKEFNETITLSETVVKANGKTYSETLTITDNIVKAIGKTFTESAITISETFSKVLAHVKTFSETITLSETFLKEITKTFSETITITETIIKAVAKIFTETAITMSDIIIKATGKTYSEIITITETFSKGVTRIFSETITITDIMVSLRAAVLNFTDTISISDMMWRFKRRFLTFTKQTPDSSSWTEENPDDPTWTRRS